MMKKIKYQQLFYRLVLLILGFNFQNSFAQQVPLIDQYYINPTFYNPANVGDKGLFNSYLLRNQKFKDFDGGQVTHLFTADLSLFNNQQGVGFNLTSDDVGLFSNTQLLASYSYRVRLNKVSSIRLGLSAGLSDFRVNLNEIHADPNDTYLTNSEIKSTDFMANLGAFYTYNDLFISLTVPQLLNNSLKDTEGSKETTYKLVRHMLLGAGYKINLEKYNSERFKNITITPSVLLRYAKSTPVQYDINVLAEMKDKVWFAVSYRDEFSIGLNAGIHFLDKLSFGYSYDIGIKKVGRYTANNHEFMLAYKIKSRKNSVEQNKINSEISTLKSILSEEYDRLTKARENLEKMKVAEKAIDTDRDGVPNYKDQCSDTPPFYRVDANGCSIDSDGDGIVDSEDYCPNVPGSEMYKGCPDPTEQKVKINKAYENIYFAFGKYALTDFSKNKLDKIADLMKNNELYILKMNGHTDDIGSVEINDELSFKRILEAKKYLLRSGVPDNRIIIEVHGESKPIIENSTVDSRAKNRRVNFEIYIYQ